MIMKIMLINAENNEEKEKYKLYKNEPLNQFSLELLSLQNKNYNNNFYKIIKIQKY